MGRSLAATCRVAGSGTVSFLVGDASRIESNLNEPPEAGALLPLRGFFARSLVGYTRNTKKTVMSAWAISQMEQSTKLRANTDEYICILQ